MPFADLGDVRLFYTDDGPPDDRAPLLLIHGWGADSHVWVWHIPTLAEKRRVIAVDLRGHGYSSAPPSGNTPRQMTEDLVRLCALLGVETVIPVGHSMGAQVASYLAVEHPALVEACVTIDPGYGWGELVASVVPSLIEALPKDTLAAAVQVDQWCYTPASPPWLRQWHNRRLHATPPHVLLEAYEAMFGGVSPLALRPYSDSYITRRECPVLTFWADPAQAEWESALFKHPLSRAVSWPGSGHRLHEERPAEFLLVLKKWLKEIR